MAVSVVVVGSGIAGLSTAFHLADKGARPIVLVDKGNVGSGSSSRSGAVNTMLMATEGTTRARGVSFDIFERFDQILDDYQFHQVGCMAIYTEEQFESARQLHPMHLHTGARFEVLNRRQVEEYFPDLSLQDGECGVLDLRGGYSEPERYIPALAAKVRQLGVEIREQTSVQRFLVKGGKVRGVVLADGQELAVDATVCTVNAWANSLLSHVGQALPARNFVIERHVTLPFSRAPRLPATNDDARSVYYRPTEDGRLLIGGEAYEPEQVPMPGPEFDLRELEPEPTCLPFLIKAVRGRLPFMDRAEFDYHRVGLVSYPIDFTPNIGPVAALPGLYLGTHFCSGGFGYHPVAGLLLAEYIVDGQTGIDASEFSPDRFRDFDIQGYLAQDITRGEMIDAHVEESVGFVCKRH